MTCMHHWCPVSPFLKATSFIKSAPEEKDIEIDDVVRKEDVVFDEPIVGHRPTSITDPAPRPLVTPPKDMSEREFAEHCLTHLPYCPSCQYCVAGKRNNVLHFRSPGGRKIPFVAADYGFLTMRDADEVIPFICVYVKPWRIYFASVIDIKGPNPLVVKRLARWFGELGLSQFAYRSDREPTIRASLRAATIMAGLKAIDEPKPNTHTHTHTTATPMAPLPGLRFPTTRLTISLTISSNNSRRRRRMLYLSFHSMMFPWPHLKRACLVNPGATGKQSALFKLSKTNYAL